MQGIYKITNTENGKVYIGKSIDIQRRWIQHKSSLNRNIHHSGHLQNAWNKYGEENFVFEILCETNSELEINEKEIYYIGLYNSTDEKYGYNLGGGGEGGIMHEDTKTKISISKRGNNSTLSVDDVRKIKMAIYCLMDRKEISKMFNIPIKSITQISIGQSFNYVCPELKDKIHNIKQQLIDERNEYLLRLYDKGMTIREIHNETEYSESIIEKCIYKYRIPHSDKKDKQIEKYYEVFRLHNEGVIDYQISKILKISASTVGRYLKGEQVPWNKAGNTKINEEISKQIYDMYFNKNMTSTDIGEIFGIANTTIMSEVNKYKFARSGSLLSQQTA